MSKEVFSSYNTSEKTVKDFLDEYNNCIDVGTRYSQLGHSK
jgi:hypothetical protein